MIKLSAFKQLPFFMQSWCTTQDVLLLPRHKAVSNSWDKGQFVWVALDYAPLKSKDTLI